MSIARLAGALLLSSGLLALQALQSVPSAAEITKSAVLAQSSNTRSAIPAALNYDLTNYTDFSGKNWTMRVYNGTYVSLLIPDVWYTDSSWRHIDASYGAPAWPGLRDDLISFLIQKLDQGYLYYKDVFGYEPPGDGPVKIAFVSGMGAAGLGVVGGKGFQVGPATLEYSMYAALDNKVPETIFWHEMGRNFGIGANDVGIKFVLTERLGIDGFMGWQSVVSDKQFAIDQVYLLGRYFLADPAAVVDGFMTPPYNKPKIPDPLKSATFVNLYNGGDIRTGLIYQFYLENGFEAYKSLIQALVPYLGQDPVQFVSTAVDAMNSTTTQGLDYSFWLKSSSWNISQAILSGPSQLAIAQTQGKLGDMLLLGRGDDYVQVTTPGNFRIDAGDGYDTVKLPFPSTAVISNKQTRWKRVIKTDSSSIVLDFVEEFRFSDGQTTVVAQPENSMFPWLSKISTGIFPIGGKLLPAIKFSFTEALAFKLPYDWGLAVYPWSLTLKTQSGSPLAVYTQSSANTKIVGKDVYFLLPPNFSSFNSTLTLHIHENGNSFEAVDIDGNRLAQQLLWSGFNIPLKYSFSTSPLTTEIDLRGLNSTEIVDGDTTPSSTDGTNFGSIKQGGNPAIRTFVVRNAGLKPLTLGTPVVPAGFKIGNDALAPSIPAGGSDSFSVQLLTTTAGSKAGQITFSNNDANETPYNFAISGSVIAAPEIDVRGINGLAIADGDLYPSLTDGTNFGTVSRGVPSPVKTYMVRNTGSKPLTLGTPVLPTGFKIGSNPLASSIAAGSSDTFSVQMLTTTTGVKAGQITFSNNDANENPYNFRISGTVN